jgi:hypothetical protein
MTITSLNPDTLIFESKNLSELEGLEINKIIKFTDNWNNVLIAKITSINLRNANCEVLHAPLVFNFKDCCYEYFENLNFPLSSTTIGRTYDFDKLCWLENNQNVNILTDSFEDLYKNYQKKSKTSIKIQNLSHRNISNWIKECNLTNKIFVINKLALDNKQLLEVDKTLKLQNLFATYIKTDFWLPEITDKISSQVANYYADILELEVVLLTYNSITFDANNIQAFCVSSNTDEILILKDK